MTFRFEDLPPELRSAVYEDLLTVNDGRKSAFPQILAISSKIRTEATGILYGPDNKLIVSLTHAFQGNCYSTDATVGNRQSFFAESPECKDEHSAFVESLRAWPRDLSMVEFVVVKIDRNMRWRSVYQQLLILARLLEGNAKVQIEITMDTFERDALISLKKLRADAIAGIWSCQSPGLNHKPAFHALEHREGARKVYHSFAVTATMQRETDDFLDLQKRAGMIVRGAELFDGTTRMTWIGLCWLIRDTPEAGSLANPPREVQRQIRVILDSAWVVKIKQEARDRIAAMSRS